MSFSTTSDIYSVEYHSPVDIWLGADNRIFKTINGSTWTQNYPLLDNFGGQLYGNIYDISLTSNTQGLCIGSFFTSSTETVTSTTNGGSVWTVVLSNNVGNFPRTFNALARFGQSVVAVGNTGHIAVTPNNGANWSYITTGITKRINDVIYISPDTVVAAGDNVFLKSVDGGQTWTVSNFTKEFKSVCGLHETIYLGEGFNNEIYKSINSGSSFITISLPFESTGEITNIGRDTLLVSGTDGLYISTSGGLYWEKFILASYNQVLAFDHLNSNNVIAAGNDGFVIRSSNVGAAPSLPIPSFANITGNYCLGDTLYLTNTTANLPGYTYQWKIDNLVIGTQYNSSVKLSIAGSHTITLTVTNSHGSATYQGNVFVTGHDLQQFSISNQQNNLCINNQAFFIIPNSQSSTSYQLRNGNTLIGAAQNGNSDTLIFITPRLTATTTFNIKAVRVNTCYTDSLIRYTTVNIDSSSLKPACLPNAPMSLYSYISSFQLININTSFSKYKGHYTNKTCESITILPVNTDIPFSFISNFAPQVTGQLKIWIDLDTSGTFNNNNEVILSKSFQGPYNGFLKISGTNQLLNVPMRMRIYFDDNVNINSCSNSSNEGVYVDYTVMITTAPTSPEANFTHVASSQCLTTVSFINNSLNSTSWLWDFGDGGNSTDKNPSHIYSSPGIFTIQLISNNSYGSDTAYQNITISIPDVPIPAVCSPAPNSNIGFCNANSKVYISGVNINSILSAGGSSSIFYNDITCVAQTHLTRDSTYNLFYSVRNIQSNFLDGYTTAYLDYNNDGVFDETTEDLNPGGLAQNFGPPSYFPITVPSNAVTGVPLRLRIIASQNFFFSPCDTSVCGQYLDFTVYIDPTLEMNLNFSASDTTICNNEPVDFINTTTNATTYLWDFGDGTTSTIKDPTHTYSSGGKFSVKLIACNATGDCDTLVRTSYMTVKENQFIQNINICTGQSFPVGNNLYNAAGTYIDSLVAANGCDSIVTTNLSVLPFPAIAIVAQGPVSFCTGGNVVLTAPPSFNNYQWLRNSIPIAGANSQNYTATLPGTYKCQVANAAFCTAYSNLIFVRVPCVPIENEIDRTSNIFTFAENEFSIFPNPNSGQFRLLSPPGNMQIFSSTGELVFNLELTTTENDFDFSMLPDGVYFARIKAEERVITKRIIIVH